MNRGFISAESLPSIWLLGVNLLSAASPLKGINENKCLRYFILPKFNNWSVPNTHTVIQTSTASLAEELSSQFLMKSARIYSLRGGFIEKIRNKWFEWAILERSHRDLQRKSHCNADFSSVLSKFFFPSEFWVLQIFKGKWYCDLTG